MCITTGEVFKSAKNAAEYYGISYATLIQQITGRQKTCGGGRHSKGNGMKFCYVSEMGYKANDISDYIIELKAKADMNVASMIKIQENYNQLMEMKTKYEKEMQEMMQKMMALVG